MIMGEDSLSGDNPLNMLDSSTSSGEVKARPVAVALSRDEMAKEVPRVVAAGKGAIAEQIVELAFMHGIKVREDADLAELLSALEIDIPIPVEAYVAVAEILSYVYRANASACQRNATMMQNRHAASADRGDWESAGETGDE